MKRVKLTQGEGISIAEAWGEFHDYWRKFVRTRSTSTAWVRVQEIMVLKQVKDGWTVKYRVGDATVAQAIRPALAVEILDSEILGHHIPSAWLIVNQTQVEEMIHVVSMGQVV